MNPLTHEQLRVISQWLLDKNLHSVAAEFLSKFGDEKPKARERWQADNNGPTGHGDIRYSDADPGL